MRGKVNRAPLMTLCRSPIMVYGRVHLKPRSVSSYSVSFLSAWLIILAFLLPPAVLAEERKLVLRQNMVVHEDGSVTVTETKDLLTGGNEIEQSKRSILKKDQVIGHMFRDEIQWTVRESGYSTVDELLITVTLPPSISPDSVRHVLEVRKGTRWAGTRKTTVSAHGDGGSAFVESRFPIHADETYILNISFPRGHLPGPRAWYRLKGLVLEGGHTIVSLVGMGLVLLYYLIMWIKDGRDPEKGTIIPHFETPAEMPPAAVRYFWKGSFDRLSFGTALLSMAVKGFLSIEETVDTSTPGPTYLLRIREDGNLMFLSKDERKIAEILFPPGKDTVVLGRFDEERIWKAAVALRRHLFWEYQRAFFRSSKGYWKTSSLILILTGLAVVIVGRWQGAFAVLSATLLLWWVFWWWLMIWTWRKRYFFLTLVLMIVALVSTFGPLIIAAFAYAVYRTVTADNWPIISALITATILASSALAAVPFYKLVKAPTRIGRSFLDKIEGFRHFLIQTEENPLKMLYPDDKLPEHLHNNLPYALALDIELPVLSRFSSALPTILGPGDRSEKEG